MYTVTQTGMFKQFLAIFVFIERKERRTYTVGSIIIFALEVREHKNIHYYFSSASQIVVLVSL